MKILHLIDLHGNLPWYRWVTREAPNYDLVCLSGDLIDQGDAVEQQVADVTRALANIRTPLAICSGNHDLAPAQSGDGILRHTFISMDVGKFRSIAEAALQAGNSEEIIRRHYLDLKSPAEAERFFAIAPGTSNRLEA